jgi:transcriptional regulator with XRE-family HTH domain
MVNQGEEIKKIVREKGITDEEFAKMLEITRGGVLDIYKRPRIKQKQLKEIAQKLNINYAQFLDEIPQLENTKGTLQNDAKEFYERIIRDKDVIIQLLKEKIQWLESRIGN